MAAHRSTSPAARVTLGVLVALTVSAVFVLALRGRAGAPPPGAPLDTPLARLAARLVSLHAPLPAPGPGDWRDGPGRDEPGQSYATWHQSNPVKATGARRVIYLQRIGPASADHARILALTGEFLGLYFGLPVKALEPLPVDGDWPAHARRERGLDEPDQLLSTHILREVLTPALPEDAAVLLGLTTFDLWPGRDWNFVFGQASIRDRVGVWSIARYGDPTRSKDAWRRCLLRTLKVAAHETGHMFSIAHCTAWLCNMCGSNHMEETDRHPLALCPECVPKVWEATGVDPRARFDRLAAFSEQHGLADEAAFYRRARAALGE